MDVQFSICFLNRSRFERYQSNLRLDCGRAEKLEFIPPLVQSNLGRFSFKVVT